MTTENLTNILNKLYAFNEAGIITLAEIARRMDVAPARVSEWITLRIHAPSGQTVFKLLALAANLTLKISRRPEMRERYREAFKAACEKFPTTGGN